MHERQQLSEEGMFIVVARVNAQTGEPLGPPDVISRGVVSPQGANGLVEGGRGREAPLQRTASRRVTDLGELKNEIRKDLASFLATYPKAPDHPPANS